MALRDTRSLYPGCEFACVSLGAATLSPREAAELLRAAADLGVRLADTADSYGASEALPAGERAGAPARGRRHRGRGVVSEAAGRRARSRGVAR